MNQPPRQDRFVFFVLAFGLMLSDAAMAQASRPLSRPTGVRLNNCNTLRLERRFPRMDQTLRRVLEVLTTANSTIFTGDLAPNLICIRATTGGLPGQAIAENREITIQPELIARTRNESQLAWIIAHELGHITMRHFLDGHPVEGAQADAVTRALRRMFELRDVAMEQKGVTPERTEFQRLEAESNVTLREVLGEKAAANWLESEADQVGMWFYLRAGYDPNELGWRAEQLAIAESRGLDAHSVPTERDAVERNADAIRVCNVSATSAAPDRGLARYPGACWIVWDQRFNQYALFPDLAALRDTARVAFAARDRVERDFDETHSEAVRFESARLSGRPTRRQTNE